ncbi:MAG: hypothetical protein RLP44_00835 [Aggregatilineales bacterium]
MSIIVGIYYKNENQKPITMPVAAAGTFVKFWETPSKELSLKLIPAIFTGLWIDDVGKAIELCAELNILKQFHQKVETNRDSNQIRDVLFRIDKLTELITNAVEHWEKIDCIDF